MRSANSYILLFFVFGSIYSAQSKIAKFKVKVLIDQDIGTLQVTMEDILAMQIGHTQSHVHHDFNNLLLAQLATFLMKIVKKTASRKKLSDHVILIVVNAHAHV